MFVSAHPHFLMGVFPCIPIYGVTLPFIVSSTNRLSRPIHSKHFQDLTSTKSNKTLGKSGCFGHKAAGFLSFSIPNHFFHQKSPLCSEQNPPFHDLQGEPGVGFHGHHDGQVAANVDHFTSKNAGSAPQEMVGFHGISWDFMGH